MPFTATWMDLEIIIIRQTERQISYDIAYMQNLLRKMIQMNLPIYKAETGSHTQRTNLVIVRGEEAGERDRLGVLD